MEPVQDIPRSTSMPVREEAVIKKVQEQDGIIALMQTQIEMQNEVISKHGKMFEDVFKKIEELAAKIKTLDESASKSKESTELDAIKSALWTNGGSGGGGAAGGGTETISIADMAKETAEQTMGSELASGYVYDESLGLYYDQSSGYYYDPVKQLFYNGHTKTYYSYDATTNTYHVQSAESVKRKKPQKKLKKHSKHQKIKTNPSTPRDSDESIKKESEIKVESPDDDKPSTVTLASDMEDGEISSSVPTSAESSPCSGDKDSDSNDEGEKRLTDYPPCIRAVVQSEPHSGIEKGTLFLIPFTGGTVGSKGNQHAVLLPSPSVEKTHAKVYFENETVAEEEDEENEKERTHGKYFIVDLGSKEGTFLNRKRMSESGIVSEPHELVHGSTLLIGDVTLLIHIHPGDFTCGHCEPGLLLQKQPMYEYTGENTDSKRRTEMKKMKKKYGLDRKNEGAKLNLSDDAYTDRAKTRRNEVGSDNPFAKTVVASVEQPIKDTNKGFKMLQKMGWKGEGLGNPQNTGIVEPIACEVKNDRGGLGLHGPEAFLAKKAPKPRNPKQGKETKSDQLAKTIERFKGAGGVTDESNVDNFDY